ncbi:MAG: biotin/lipoyl-containing protein [Anaerolineales bacterium]
MASVEVTLPKWGLTMEEATLVEWKVNEGESVKEGQVLATVETDKVTNELESPVSGVIREIRVAAGTSEIKVGDVLCVIEES